VKDEKEAPPDTHEATPSTTASAVKNRTVLACDDDPMTLYFYTVALRGAGFEVATAATGEECLEMARKTPPDMILLDVNLPGISGIDVCAKLKEDPATQTVPLLFVTAAFENVNDRAAGFDAGADDFVIKPFESEELLMRIKALLRTRDLQQRLFLEQQTQALLREERQHAELLRIANEELRSFTYAVSHDLRVPLLNIKGFGSELREGLSVIQSTLGAALPHIDEKSRRKLEKVLQEEIPEALRFIDTSADRMDRLIKAILALSRAGRRDLHPERLNMDELVESILKSSAHNIEKRQIKLTVGHLPDVVADRTSMEMIIGNLLSNAVNYLDPGRPGEIEVSGSADLNEAQFSVRDNGRGIDESDIGKLFQLFRRLGKQEVPGEGMGLVYVRTLIARHGGRIWCESQAGQGTTFSFVIPLSTDKVSAYARVHSGERPGDSPS